MYPHTLFPDPSFTADRVTAVFKTLRDWKDLFGSDGYYLIPRSRQAIIEGKFADEQQRRQQAGLYCHQYSPNASWRELAVAVYREGEREALGLVTPHLHHVKGMLFDSSCLYIPRNVVNPPVAVATTCELLEHTPCTVTMYMYI